MRSQGKAVQAAKFEKHYLAYFAGIKTDAELKEMEWQEILTIAHWALKMLNAKSPQDLPDPPKELRVPNSSPLAVYVLGLKRRGAAVWVNEKYQAQL
jgi:hypothetical protein